MPFNFKTPPIPDEIKNIYLVDYKNIFSYPNEYFPKSGHHNLWGSETLCGDWDGRLLIILKDFAPTWYIENRSDGRPPYSHTIGSPTNSSLVRFINHAYKELGHTDDLVCDDGSNNTSCGILYASASFLLRATDGPGMNVRITRQALQRGWPALKFTISNMKNLTDIVLCGKEAFDGFCLSNGSLGDRRNILNKGSSLDWRGKRIHLTYHPQPTAVNTRHLVKGMNGREYTQCEWNRIIHSAFGSARE